MSSKNTQRKKNKNKKSQMKRQIYKKGGCGSCKADPSPFLTGGSSIDLAINQNPAVIPFNQSQGSSMDPNDSSQIVSARMQPNMISGGKKKNNKNSGKKRKTIKKRKIRGGNIADPSAANAVSSFGNTTGLASAYNLMTGNQSVNPSVTNQPIGNTPFGEHNPALI